MKQFTIAFRDLSMNDLATVGGKNASLGEMIKNLSKLGIVVPDGFAITVDAFYEFLYFNTLSPLLQDELGRLDLEANVIFPIAVSNRLNVNALVMLLSIFAGGILWGLSGMILFVPFVGIAKLIADHNPNGERYR